MIWISTDAAISFRSNNKSENKAALKPMSNKRKAKRLFGVSIHHYYIALLGSSSYHRVDKSELGFAQLAEESSDNYGVAAPQLRSVPVKLLRC